jgi:prepilin-type N-terminal cleavage/methylation domain-containing protein
MSIGRCRAPAAARRGCEAGFTLIELLVVIVIVGILVAVALPSLLSQREKATDAAAKAVVRTAETAAEAYSTEHSGFYGGMSVAALQAIEPALKDKSNAELILAESLGEGHGYIVESKTLGNSDAFTIERTATGETVRSCAPEAHGGCLKGGHW